MELETDFSVVSADATEVDIADLIDSLGKGPNTIAILSADDDYYIQAISTPDPDPERFAIEFRDGAPVNYWADFVHRELVLAAMLSFFRGDSKWRTMFEWRLEGRSDPAGEVRPRLLVFTAAGHLGCRVFDRQLAELEASLGDRLDVERIDPARSPELTAEWGVSTDDLPVQLYFDRTGGLRQVLKGVRSAHALQSLLVDRR